MARKRVRLPEHRRTKAEVLGELEAARQGDVPWKDGRVFGLVYDAGEEVDELLKLASLLYFSENGLNPTAFPSIKKLEADVVSMAADLLGGDAGVVGNMTSGGTESCLMAVKTARDWARIHRPSIRRPAMALPVSAHPAFEKAGAYFDLDVVRYPVARDLRADLDALMAALTENTILIVGSAPSYPHGVVDPIVSMGQIAAENELLFHVDACVGGFMLPFVEQLGYPVPAFDFRVRGVTSMSADIHKYGYGVKGASVVLYRERALRRHQLFVATEWSGGVYPSATMAGTRPAAPIASAWAVLNYLGWEGYLAITETVMQAVQRLRSGVADIDGVHVMGDPVMSVLALGSERLNPYEIGDELGMRGWHLDRQHLPPSLHMTVNYAHIDRVEAFLEDLSAVVEQVRNPSLHQLRDRMLLGGAKALTRVLPESWVSRLTSWSSSLLGVQGSSLPERTAPIYGMLGTLPNRGDLKELVLDLVESFTDT